MVSEFSIRILAGERPINAASFGIALALPAIDFAPRGRPVHQSSPKTLTIQDADFDLRHVQPARMLGRVVKLHPSQQRASGGRTEHLLEARAEMGVEVVQNQVNLSGGGIAALKQVLYEGDEFRHGSALGDLDHPTPAFGLNRHEHIAGALANIFVIVLGRRPGFHGQPFSAVSDQLLALLVDTDYRFALAIGPCVQFQHIVHAPSIFLGQAANAPHQLAPGFKEVFFSSRRILSRLIWRICGWRRAASVSNATVQRLAPCGGEEQAKAVTCASSGAQYRLGWPGRSTSHSAYSSPPSRYAARVRQIAVRPTPSTSMIWPSGICRSRAARIWARLNSRAMCSPLDRNDSTNLRSCLLRLSSVWRIAYTPQNVAMQC